MNFLKKLFGGQRIKEGTQSRENPQTKDSSQVEFKREARKQHPAAPSIQTLTKTYAARSQEAAIAFLQKQKITESFVYVEVVTPSGIFGTDKTGDIYDSGGELPGDSATLLLQDENSKEKASLRKTDPAEWKILSESLHTAAEDGDTNAVAAMLRDNPDLALSRVEFFGETSLHAAAGTIQRETARHVRQPKLNSIGNRRSNSAKQRGTQSW